MFRNIFIGVIGFVLLMASSGYSQTISLSVDTAVTGNTIYNDFIGFSFNPAYTTQYFGTSYNGNNDRVISLQLFNNFRPYQNPAIRFIGANNSYWKGTGIYNSQPPAWNNTPSFNCSFCPTLTSPSFTTTIDSTDLNDIKGFVESLNYNPQVLFGVNLAVIDSARARDFGLNIKNTLSSVSDLQFEIGNEPDAFISNNRRLGGYNIVPYVKEFNLIAKGLFPFGYAAAPAFAKTNNTSSTSWSDSIAYLIDSSQGRIKTVTYHDYPLGLSSNPTTVNTYLNKLLSNQYTYDAIANITTGLAPSINITNARSLKFRMAEVNSVAGGGVDLVSNSFGAALWSIDYMFELVRSGGVGINFSTEGGSTVYYSPFTYSSTFTGSGKVGIRPLYYGALFFAKAVQGNAKLLKQTFTSSVDSNQLKIWSVKDTLGVVRIMIINRGTSLTDVSNATIQLTLPGRTTTAKVYLLKATSANGIADTTGVTIAGQTVSNITGSVLNTEMTTTVVPTSSVYSIAVKAATAVVLEIQPNPCLALAPMGTGSTRCGAGTVTISASPSTGETIDWYSASSLGTLLASGTSNYTTTNISASAIYYAEARNISGGCVSASRTPVIATVNPLSTLSLTSLPATISQIVNIGNAIANIVYAIGGAATGTTVSGLPANVNGNFTAGTFTISGTPNQLGTFNYTVTTSGSSCTEVVANGTITVNGLLQSNADYRSNGSGNFSNPSTWEYYNGVGYVAATIPPSGGNNITIRNGHHIILDVSHTVAGGKTFLIAAGSLTINPTIGIEVAATGILNFNSQSVVVKSTASGTAAVGKILGTLSGATNVTVERYLPNLASRRWRLLSIPTTTIQSINASWQNGQLPTVVGTNNMGTWITSSLTNATLLGYDATTTGNSMLAYNAATSLWDGITTNTTTTGIGTDRGYMIYIRGDRNSTSVNTYNTSTTLSTTGTLKSGNYPVVPLPINANKNALIGNPYASAIDVRNVILGGNADRVFYVWDPRISGSYGLGAYQTLTWNGSDYIITPGGGSYGVGASIMNTIQSGQAFLAHATGGSGTVQFNENCKTTGSSNVSRGYSQLGRLSTNLHATDSNGSNLADGVMVLFDSSFNNLVDGNDAKKLTNFGENFGMVRNGQLLAVEQRKPIKPGDTVFYSMGNLRKNQNYKLSFEAKNFIIPGMEEARLEDKYLGIINPIDLIGNTEYHFAINSDTNSFATNRFRVVFYKSLVLPLSFTSIKAWQQNRNSILVEWHVENQQNIQGYEVQKSTDGNIFSKVGTQVAIATNRAGMTYKWQDIYPIKADNYYRIKSIAASGEAQYSKVVKLNFGLSGSSISIYPNPIKNRTIFLQLNDISAGKYKVRLLNDLGQEQMTRTFSFGGGNGLQTIPFNKRIINGLYSLEITSDNEKIFVQIILIVND